jgi:hypothetical protein
MTHHRRYASPAAFRRADRYLFDDGWTLIISGETAKFRACARDDQESSCAAAGSSTSG